MQAAYKVRVGSRLINMSVGQATSLVSKDTSSGIGERGGARWAGLTSVQERGAGVASGEQAGSFQTEVVQKNEKQS